MQKILWRLHVPHPLPLTPVVATNRVTLDVACKCAPGDVYTVAKSCFSVPARARHHHHHPLAGRHIHTFGCCMVVSYITHPLAQVHKQTSLVAPCPPYPQLQLLPPPPPLQNPYASQGDECDEPGRRRCIRPGGCDYGFDHVRPARCRGRRTCVQPQHGQRGAGKSGLRRRQRQSGKIKERETQNTESVGCQRCVCVCCFRGCWGWTWE